MSWCRAKVFVVAEQDSRGHAASLRALAAAEVNERQNIRANSRRD
jgi:hypothetical protein